MTSIANIDSIVCSAATERSDLRAAFQLIYEKYLQAGLTRPNLMGLRIADYQLTSQCEIIVAKVDERVVGTISMFAGIARRLPLEHAFPHALSDFRINNLSLVEIGCLAALDSDEGIISPTLAALIRSVSQRARFRNFDRMVAAVHPRHGRFYSRAMGFEVLSSPARYESVEGHLAVCVAGDPRNRSGYRSPWREMLFDRPLVGCSPRQQVMSPVNRNYFINLKQACVSMPNSRAA